MDIDGNELWSNIIQVPGTLPLTSQVLSDSGNNVFVSGKALSLLDGTQNEYLIRLTSLGELVWSKTFPRINSFFFDPTAGFLLGGDLEQTGGEYLLTGGALDPDLGALYPFAVKFDDLGTTMCEEDLTVSLNDTLLTYEVDTLFWMSKELMNVSEDSIIRERFNEYNLPIVSLLDTTFCPQDPIMVTLDATANFALSYEWENGDTTAMRDVTEEGDYMVTVTFDTLACFQLCDTSTISVFEFPTVNINLNNGEFCETGEFFLSAGVSQGNPAYIYEWSTGEETATISVTEFGDYLVTVTDQCDNSSTNQVNVSEANLPEPIIPNSEINADSYCDPDREIFLINTPSGGVGPYTFMWDTGETGPNIAVTAFGEYNVTISDSCNESIVQVFTVDESILPTPDVINLVKDTETFCETEAITINIANANAGFVNVVWSNGETNVSSIDVNQPGIYTVEGMDCNQPVSASIEVEAGDFPEGLKFPNIFSPTDIDSNRSFGPFVECPDIIEDYELKVFDRWGKMVFESQSVDVRWNGAVGTKSQPSEVFYWYATYNTPAGEVLLEGDVTLIR